MGRQKIRFLAQSWTLAPYWTSSKEKTGERRKNEEGRGEGAKEEWSFPYFTQASNTRHNSL